MEQTIPVGKVTNTGSSGNYVSYEPENKTEIEKEQARTNIDAYKKPVNGIPETDLAKDVQDKLNKPAGGGGGTPEQVNSLSMCPSSSFDRSVIPLREYGSADSANVLYTAPSNGYIGFSYIPQGENNCKFRIGPNSRDFSANNVGGNGQVSLEIPMAKGETFAILIYGNNIKMRVCDFMRAKEI